MELFICHSIVQVDQLPNIDQWLIFKVFSGRVEVHNINYPLLISRMPLNIRTVSRLKLSGNLNLPLKNEISMISIAGIYLATASRPHHQLSVPHSFQIFTRYTKIHTEHSSKHSTNVPDWTEMSNDTHITTQFANYHFMSDSGVRSHQHKHTLNPIWTVVWHSHVS